jgi:tetratricopeptide (TPR) repeat protein
MSKMNELYSILLESNFFDNEVVLNFISSNKIIIENSVISNEQDLEDYLNLNNHYLKALFEVGRYSLCIEAFDKIINLIECSKINNLNSYQLKINTLYFYKGASLFRLKKYKKAKKIFEKLISDDNKNDLYKSWLEAVKVKLNRNYSGFLIVLGTIIIFGKSIFSLSFENKMYVNYFGILLYCIAGLLELKYYLTSKK